MTILFHLQDVYTIDEAIPRSLRAFLITIFPVLSTMLVVAVASPWFLVVVAPLLIIYIFIQVHYTSMCLFPFKGSSHCMFKV